MTSTLGTSDQIPVSAQIPGYRLRRHVGTDVTGLWFDCEQESLGRKLTLKTLRPELEGREDVLREFLAEMDRLAGIEHPNLLRLLDTRREVPPAIVVERIGNQTLAHLLEDDKPIPPEVALGAVRDAALGIQYLHEKGLTHKNPSPSMLALNEHGIGRLVTFRNIVPLEEVAARRGKLVSDPNYVAPEQLGGEREIGPLVSVYQLGALLFHFLAGSPPHEEADAKATALAHFRKEFPGLKGKRPFLNNGVYDLVEQATRKTPAERMPLAEMAEKLASLAEGKDTGGTTAAPKSRRRRRRRY